MLLFFVLMIYEFQSYVNYYKNLLLLNSALKVVLLEDKLYSKRIGYYGIPLNFIVSKLDLF